MRGGSLPLTMGGFNQLMFFGKCPEKTFAVIMSYINTNVLTNENSLPFVGVLVVFGVDVLELTNVLLCVSRGLCKK